MMLELIVQSILLCGWMPGNGGKNKGLGTEVPGKYSTVGGEDMATSLLVLPLLLSLVLLLPFHFIALHQLCLTACFSLLMQRKIQDLENVKEEYHTALVEAQRKFNELINSKIAYDAGNNC